MTQNPVSPWQVFKITGVFFMASVVCCVMLVFRRPIYGHTTSHFLVWNLFLAWIPFVLAAVAGWLWTVGPTKKWQLAWCSGAWLVFYPNAPYIITDMIHLRRMEAGPIWYDLIVTAAFAWTGFLLGFASLYLMQRLVARIWGWSVGWLFALVTMGLTAFGIYLGRFIRLNSWDVISAPFAVLRESVVVFRHPFAHHESLLFIAVTTVFLYIAYAMVYALTHLDRGGVGTQLVQAVIRKGIWK